MQTHLRFSILGLIGVGASLLLSGFLSTFIYSPVVYETVDGKYVQDYTALLVGVLQCALVFLCAYGVYLRNRYVYWCTLMAVWGTIFLVLASVFSWFFHPVFLTLYREMHLGLLMSAMTFLVLLVVTAIPLTLRSTRICMTDTSFTKRIIGLGSGIVIVSLSAYVFFVSPVPIPFWEKQPITVPPGTINDAESSSQGEALTPSMLKEKIMTEATQLQEEYGRGSINRTLLYSVYADIDAYTLQVSDDTEVYSVYRTLSSLLGECWATTGLYDECEKVESDGM